MKREQPVKAWWANKKANSDRWWQDHDESALFAKKKMRSALSSKINEMKIKRNPVRVPVFPLLLMKHFIIRDGGSGISVLPRSISLNRSWAFWSYILLSAAGEFHLFAKHTATTMADHSSPLCCSFSCGSSWIMVVGPDLWPSCLAVTGRVLNSPAAVTFRRAGDLPTMVHQDFGWL